MWPLLPACNFQVGTLTTVNIETRVMSVISQVDMSLGERQVLRLDNPLVFGRDGSKEPTCWTCSTQCTVDHEAPQTDFFHALCCARIWHFSSIEYFNQNRCIVCRRIIATLELAGDMPQPDVRPKDYESATGGMILESASLTGTGEKDIQDMGEKIHMSKKKKAESIRNEAESKL